MQDNSAKIKKKHWNIYMKLLPKTVLNKKKQYMERQNNNVQAIHSKYGNVKRVENFKYLRECIQIGGLNKASSTEITKQLQRANKLAWTHYNYRSMLRHVKLRH